MPPSCFVSSGMIAALADYFQGQNNGLGGEGGR
jgi:hypothetical protein